MEQELSESRRPGAVALTVALASLALLAAAVLWAHHWNVLTVTLVGAWAVVSLCAPVLSFRAWSWGTGGALAGWAVTTVGLSWLALALAAAAYAAGADIPGCGGG